MNNLYKEISGKKHCLICGTELVDKNNFKKYLLCGNNCTYIDIDFGYLMICYKSYSFIVYDYDNTMCRIYDSASFNPITSVLIEDIGDIFKLTKRLDSLKAFI